MIRIGPAGNSIEFYESGNKHTYQAARWLAGMGLNAFEYSFGRGVSMSGATAAKISEEFSRFDVQISAHAPYYINFASENEENIQKSFGYIINSIKAVVAMGGRRVVFHPGAQQKSPRAEAFSRTLCNIRRLTEFLEKELPLLGAKDVVLCAETMGKHGQIGNLEEVVEICSIADFIYPCLDFGHINSYLLGGIRTKDDYRRILDFVRGRLGDEKTNNMHIHFSKIMFGKCGEIKHLTLADTEYGPEYPPLAALIDEYQMTPTIICESDGVMASDAAAMRGCHKS